MWALVSRVGMGETGVGGGKGMEVFSQSADLQTASAYPQSVGVKG